MGIRAGYIPKLIFKCLNSNTILASRICLVRLQTLTKDVQFSHLFERFFSLFFFLVLLPYTTDRSTITHNSEREKLD